MRMRTKQGVVTSAAMQGTVTVTVHRSVFHPLYRKRFRISKKFLADAKDQDLGVGDIVVIAECRPLSKLKHFRVTEVLKRAPRVSEMQDEADVEALKPKEAEEKATLPSSPT